ncbi:efflux RND transporter permease subunit [Flammeovirga sp. OC4]|uniref:efflux RND transporter permease subunit n=1 Tax=Flammeovirga sp. OC4 TaxID=1382345 RepID=UPI0005C53297|nr:efflux RND transporter permease subunit [Flammeovirga sp. OC4]
MGFRILLITFILSILGFASLPYLTINYKPKKEDNKIRVTVNMDNTSPRQMEEDVISILEGAFSQINELKNINSFSYYNSGEVELEFDVNANKVQKKFEVMMMIRQVYHLLPKHCSYPTISRYNPNFIQNELLSISLNKPNYAEEIKEEISKLKGINKIEIQGERDSVYVIKYHKDLLDQYGLSLKDIKNKISSNFKNDHLGKVNYEASIYKVNVGHNLSRIKDLAALEIYRKGYQIIRLGDVSSINLEQKRLDHLFRINGENTIYLNIYTQKKANEIEVSDAVRKKLETLRSQYNIKLVIESDSSKLIKKEIDKLLKRSSLAIVILFLFSWLVYQKVKVIIILMTSLIVNSAVLLLLVNIFQIDINIYTIVGISISIGFIIDNFIISINSLEQKNEKVNFVLFITSLTTIITLLFVLLLPEEERKGIEDFSIIISLNLLISLIVSCFFIPYFSQLLKIKKVKTPLKSKRQSVVLKYYFQHGIDFLYKKKVYLFLILIFTFGIPNFKIPYKNEIAKNTIFTSHEISKVEKLFGGLITAFLKKEKISTVDNDLQDKLVIVMTPPFGTTLTTLDSVTRRLENLLHSHQSSIEKVKTNIDLEQSKVELTFSKNIAESVPFMIKQEVISYSKLNKQTNFDIYGFGKSFTNNNNIIPLTFYFSLKGFNLNDLNTISDSIENILTKNKKIYKLNMFSSGNWWDNSTKKEKLKISINEHFNSYEVFNEIQKYSPLLHYNSILIDNEYFDYSFENKDAEAFTTYQLSQLNFNNYPLKSIIKLKKETTENKIKKSNRNYIRNISLSYKSKYKIAVSKLTQIVENINANLPIGYSLTFEKEEYSKLSYHQKIFIVLIVVIIYMFCAILFESFYQPLIIISIIPISFIGVFFVFTNFNFKFDEGGFASLILLGGISVNSSIYIIDAFNNLKGINSRNKTFVSLLIKFKPILLTIISTIVGMIPFLLYEDNFWYSLAIGTISGLISSILGVVIMIPICLKMLRY